MYHIFSSKMNNEQESFEIYESSMNVGNLSFRNSVIDSMLELNISTVELSELTEINFLRLHNLFCCQEKFNDYEIEIIKQKLNIKTI